MIFITGANGFVGRPLCAALVNTGRTVVAATRHSSPEKKLVLSTSWSPVRWITILIGNMVYMAAIPLFILLPVSM